jgi:hypothetical protein
MPSQSSKIVLTRSQWPPGNHIQLGRNNGTSEDDDDDVAEQHAHDNPPVVDDS